LALEPDPSPCGRIEGPQDLEKSALPRSRGSGQGQHLPLGDVEIDPPQDLHSLPVHGVGLGEPRYLDERTIHHAIPPPDGGARPWWPDRSWPNRPAPWPPAPPGRIAPGP